MALDVDALNALTRRWSVDRADLDEQENRARINYRNLLQNNSAVRDLDFSQLGVGLADQGLTHSGIAVKSGLDLANAHQRRAAQEGETHALDLSSIARRRLEAEAEFNAQRGVLQRNAYTPVA